MTSSSDSSSSDDRYSDLSSETSHLKNHQASLNAPEDDKEDLDANEGDEASKGNETSEIETEGEEEVDDETRDNSPGSSNSAQSHGQDIAQDMMHERQHEQLSEQAFEKSDFSFSQDHLDVEKNDSSERFDGGGRNTSTLGKRSFLNYDSYPKDADMDFGRGGKSMSMHLEENMGGALSRSFNMQKMPGDLSPSLEFGEGNKRSTILCEFFAKGWCIRGSSCRFSHQIDDLSHRPMTEENALVTNREGERIISEGSSKMQVPADYWPVTSSKYDPSFVSPFNGELDASMIRGMGPGDYRGKDVSVNGNHPRSGSGLFATGDSYMKTSASSSAFQGNDLVFPRKHNILVSGKEGDNDAPLRGSLFSSRTHPFRSSWSKCYASGTCESSFSFSSSSQKADTVYSQMVMNGGENFHTPIFGSSRRSCSPFSAVHEGDLHLNNHSWAPMGSSGSKIRLPLSNWEPSVPFKPSFFIGSSSLSSPGDQYDPLRDSIEQRASQDWSNNAYPYYIGTSIRTMSNYGIAGTSVSKLDNANAVADERKHLACGLLYSSDGPANVDFNMGSRHKSKGEMHKDAMVSRMVQQNDAGIDLVEEDTRKMSKAARHFRTRLIDFVKELLQPIWHKVNFSKDNYKMIVRKSVDKVLSTLEEEQIPSTGDAIKQYLASSRRKILKLVEGYVDKYGK